MSEFTRELKPCPICGSRPRYWVWNYGAIVECWCQNHRIQCEGKTLDEAVEAWERRAAEQPEIIHCKDCKHWMRAYLDISGKFGCNVMRDYTAPNDYCFKAERKEDAKNSVDM